MAIGDSADIVRDEKGRVIAADGYPIAGLAEIDEVIAISTLSRSKIYLMINSGELETKQFGKAKRITWASVRKVFLSSAEN